MQKRFTPLTSFFTRSAVLLLLMLLPLLGQSAAFTPGNSLVVRVSPGGAATGGTGYAVFLDEYTSTGTFVQSIPLPTVGSGANRRFVLSSSATSEGALSLSADGKSVVLGGYDAAVGTASVNGTTAAAPRVIASLDGTGTINTATGLTAASTYPNNNFRGVTTTDGSQFWLAGSATSNNGVRTAAPGATTSTDVSTTTINIRVVGIFGGQLYYSTGSGTIGIYAVGTGTPINSGNTSTLTVTVGGTSPSPYGFQLLDLNPAVPGVDVAYVADDRGTAGTATTQGGGILKYSLVSGSWVYNGAIPSTASLRGLTAQVAGGSTPGVTLFATANGALYSTTDATGYNATPTATLTSRAVVTGTDVFRGVATAPSAAPAITLLNPNSGAVGSTVVITGTGFYNGITPLSVSFNGTAATAFTLNSATQITATVPTGATTGNVTVTTQSGTSGGVTFTVSAAAASLTVTPTTTFTAFATTTGTPSVAQTYALTGSNLTDDVTVTAPTGYEVAQSVGTSTTTPGTYAATQTVPQADATAGRTVYVRLTGTTAGTYGTSGTPVNVTNASTSATTKNIGVFGTVTTPAAATVTTGIIAGSPFCVGASGVAVSVPFTSTGTFTAGNVYTAFIGTTSIGTLTSTANLGTIPATIPSSIGSGTTYRIRVDASAPATTGTDNGTDLTVVNYKTNEVTAYTATPGNTTVALAWTLPANCVTRVVIIARQGSAVTVSPTGAFTANAAFGSGTDLGTVTNPNQYVVYDGLGTSVTVTALTNASQYFFKAFTSNGDGFSNGTSTSATPSAPIAISEVLLPQLLVGHVAGGTTHTNRLPYAYRATLSGLLPNATYRYFNKAVVAGDAATSGGAGNCIFPVAAGAFVRSTSPGLVTAGNYGTLTADGSGSYTGWFILEPSGDGRFDAGNAVQMRVILNDGNNGTSAVSYPTIATTVAVRELGATAAQATGVQGASQATASNFVFIYDNPAGTGRPLAGTFVESDGTINATGTYATFYGTNVDGQAGAYGLLTPNDNANGIRYIEQRDLATGAVVGCPATSATGTWPSGTVTVSPTGGSTPLALSQTDAPLTCDVLVGFNPATVTLPEGNTGTTTALVSVTVAGTPASPLTVTVTDTGTGTATAGTDYIFVPQVLTFTAAGTQTVSLTVNGERTVEPNETVLLSLAAAGTPATVTTATATVTILDDDTVLPALLLEEDFDYPTGTQLVAGTLAQYAYDPATGWAYHSSTNLPVATAGGNLSKQQYPQGAALTATPAGPSSRASLVLPSASGGQDINKRFNRAGVTTVIYTSFVINVSAADAVGDYFLHLFNATAPASSPFNGRVFAKAAGAGFNLGLSINGNSAASTYPGTVYAFNTPYLLVMKYENSTATGNTDAVSLFVFDDANPATAGIFTPQTEPATPFVGPLNTGTNSFSLFNAVALRQGGASGSGIAPTLTLDGLRVATTWGVAVGRPSFTTPGGGLNTGNYYDLTLNNGDQVSMNGVVTVENKLVLTSGLLLTDATNQLVLVPAATVAGGSSTSFVSGPVKRPVGVVANVAGAFTSFTFPVGQAAAYRPLILNVNTQSSNTTYTGIQNETPPTQNLTVGDPSGTDLTRVSYRRYFTLTPDVQPTGYAGTITLSFDTDDFVNSPADASFVVAKRGTTPATWVNIDRSANTGTATTGAPVAGTLTSGSFTSFSDFSLASTSTNGGFPGLNPLPVELSHFSAQRQAGQVVAVQWTTASERNSARFEVQRSRDGREYATVATVAAQGTSTHAIAYAALDKVAPTGRLYYRLRQIDRDGSSAFSPVVLVDGAGETAKVQLYPNPSHSRISFIAESVTSYRVLSQLGQPLLKGMTEVGTASISVETLPTGLYFLELQTATGRTVQKFEKATD